MGGNGRGTAPAFRLGFTLERPSEASFGGWVRRICMIPCCAVCTREEGNFPSLWQGWKTPCLPGEGLKKGELLIPSEQQQLWTEGPDFVELFVTNTWVCFIALVLMGFPAHVRSLLPPLGRSSFSLGTCFRDRQCDSRLTDEILKQTYRIRFVRLYLKCCRN